jgi:hypothetical protein
MVVGGTALVLLVLMLVVVFALWGRVIASVAAPFADWPELSINYEVTGQFYSIGDTPPETVTKEYLLSYRSLNEWRKEVVAAPAITVSDDYEFSQLGSYMEIKGGIITRYDATGGGTTTKPFEEDGILSPGFRRAPMPLEMMLALGYGDPVKKQTDTLLCWETSCEKNPWGWSFTEGNKEYIYAQDKRGIPLSVPGINILEVRVHSPQEPTSR